MCRVSPLRRMWQCLSRQWSSCRRGYSVTLPWNICRWPLPDLLRRPNRSWHWWVPCLSLENGWICISGSGWSFPLPLSIFFPHPEKKRESVSHIINGSSLPSCLSLPERRAACMTNIWWEVWMWWRCRSGLMSISAWWCYRSFCSFGIRDGKARRLLFGTGILSLYPSSFAWRTGFTFMPWLFPVRWSLSSRWSVAAMSWWPSLPVLCSSMKRTWKVRQSICF